MQEIFERNIFASFLYFNHLTGRVISLSVPLRKILPMSVSIGICFELNL